MFSRSSTLGRLVRLKLALGGLAVIAVAVVVAILAPVLAPYPPNSLQTYTSESPSAQHPLGTDRIGRDQLSRLVYGARASLMVAVIAAGFGMAAGSAIGLVSAYLGGIVDALLMRWVDAMQALPGIILPLLLVAVIGGSVVTVALALGFGLMNQIGRIMRGQAMAQKERDYVLAAISVGAGPRRIMFRHIAPNCLAPVIVAGSLGMSIAIIAEAGLSFLGVGVTPPTATWGAMLSDGLGAIREHPWQVFAPGAAIFALVLALNFLGDALRDILDPRLRGSI